MDRFSSECFNQGDKERERGLRPSVYHDRYRCTAAQAQLSLATFIATPLFRKFCCVAPNARDLFEAPLLSNQRFWQQEDWCTRNAPPVDGVIRSFEAALENGITVDESPFGLHVLTPKPWHLEEDKPISPASVHSPTSQGGRDSVQFRLRPRQSQAKGWFAAAEGADDDDVDEPVAVNGAHNLYVSVLVGSDSGSVSGASAVGSPKSRVTVSLVPVEIMTMHEEDVDEQSVEGSPLRLDATDGRAAKVREAYSMKKVQQSITASMHGVAADFEGDLEPEAKERRRSAIAKLRGATTAVGAAMYMRVSLCRKLRFSFENSFL